MKLVIKNILLLQPKVQIISVLKDFKIQKIVKKIS